MIRREMIVQAFRSEAATTTTPAKKLDQAGYESPVLSTIGTAQNLLQGSWVSGDYDGYWNSFSHSY